MHLSWYGALSVTDQSILKQSQPTNPVVLLPIPSQLCLLFWKFYSFFISSYDPNQANISRLHGMMDLFHQSIILQMQNGVAATSTQDSLEVPASIRACNNTLYASLRKEHDPDVRQMIIDDIQSNQADAEQASALIRESFKAQTTARWACARVAHANTMSNNKSNYSQENNSPSL